MKEYDFKKCIRYCGFDNLPEGLEQYYELYEETENRTFINSTLINRSFIDRTFMKDLFVRYEVPSKQQNYMLDAADSIEKDDTLLYFTKFLVWDMCSARNRCDTDNYTNLTPSCLSEYKVMYSFLLLLACVMPSMRMLKDRQIPEEYYQKIPYRPMENQFHKLIYLNDAKVSDFPWDMNFYTCSIFLFDRFLFIPYKFQDAFKMFRNRKSKEVVALYEDREEFRRDGQINGINEVCDEIGKFNSVWKEDDRVVIANRINPMGFVEKEPITIDKMEWEIALDKGDLLLALHIPSGEGYNPERLRTSMMLALDFYKTYFPEFSIKGFWSESWLYDSRLSMVLNSETSNIVKVQRQLYIYPIKESDEMLRYEVFGDGKADPEKVELKTSLQKAVAAYMKNGGRFNTMSMIVLKEEVNQVSYRPYITEEDINRFMTVVDSHII